MPSKPTPADTLASAEYLQQSSVHADWERIYLSPETSRFYDIVFEWLAPFLRKGPVLDAGCGTGVLTVRLAGQADVVAVDLSDKALEAARLRAAEADAPHQVQFEKQDLTHLSFRDEEFPVVFCWGVLMHIPEVEAALHELMRVTAPGGFLILGENHQGSLQSRLSRLLKRGHATRILSTPAGREHWYRYSEGELVARHANIGWLISTAKAYGFVLRKRKAAQFSELYAGTASAFLRRGVHALNRVWFRLGWAGPALGNLLVFEKKA